MSVELWDDEYGNAIDEFASADAALQYVREAIDHGGPQVVARWHLDSPKGGRPLRGRELIERAMHVPA